MESFHSQEVSSGTEVLFWEKSLGYQLGALMVESAYKEADPRADDESTAGLVQD